MNLIHTLLNRHIAKKKSKQKPAEIRKKLEQGFRCFMNSKGFFFSFNFSFEILREIMMKILIIKICSKIKINFKADVLLNMICCF